MQACRWSCQARKETCLVMLGQDLVLGLTCTGTLQLPAAACCMCDLMHWRPQQQQPGQQHLLPPSQNLHIVIVTAMVMLIVIISTTIIIICFVACTWLEQFSSPRQHACLIVDTHFKQLWCASHKIADLGWWRSQCRQAEPESCPPASSNPPDQGRNFPLEPQTLSQRRCKRWCSLHRPWCCSELL